MTALQTMLLQADEIVSTCSLPGPRTGMFPSAVPGNTTVTGIYRDGNVVELSVAPEHDAVNLP